MYKLCVFAGTAEGRELVEFLAGQQVELFVCVATEYGGKLLPQGKGITISTHRMNEQEMEDLFAREGFDLVVDATHPYASVVTQYIKEACDAQGVEYLRLARGGDCLPEDGVYVSDVAQAVEYLNAREGNVLLTTGSKDLKAFSAIRDFENRVYARVLPMEDSLALCRQAGLKCAHILAVQGPFSQEMNQAMLNFVRAKYLVTKDSGAKGGFDEKIEAARALGVTSIIIGRPPQVEGIGLDEMMERLEARFGLGTRRKVTVVGIGPGSRRAMTREVEQAIEEADCIIGAKRMIQAVARPGQRVVDAIAPQQILQGIQDTPSARRVVVAMSGDVGFFSGTKKLLPLLSQWDLEVLPGLSSMAYLCARIGESYDDAVPVSVHGREHDLVIDVRKNRRIFALVGGKNGMATLCRNLTQAGLGDVLLAVGERLSYPQERITRGTAEELAEKTFDDLAVALIQNPQANLVVTHGLPDEVFHRAESVPMTKAEVRAVCLSKLALTRDAVCWDLGAGSGSVAIEMALQADRGRVYAIEKKPAALDLLRENCQAFGLNQLQVVPGTAPEACKELEAPTHAFIGGSSGNLREMIALLLEKNPAVRIVATAIALESVGELTECLNAFPWAHREVVCLSVAKNRAVGPYNLMMGQNPIYIVTMVGGGKQ